MKICVDWRSDVGRSTAHCFSIRRRRAGCSSPCHRSSALTIFRASRERWRSARSSSGRTLRSWLSDDDWGWMGPGGFRSLQNHCDPTTSGRVGSIPTLSRHHALRRWRFPLPLRWFRVRTGSGVDPLSRYSPRTLQAAVRDTATSHRAFQAASRATTSAAPDCEVPLSPRASLTSLALPGYAQYRLRPSQGGIALRAHRARRDRHGAQVSVRSRRGEKAADATAIVATDSIDPRPACRHRPRDRTADHGLEFRSTEPGSTASARAPHASRGLDRGHRLQPPLRRRRRVRRREPVRTSTPNVERHRCDGRGITVCR